MTQFTHTFTKFTRCSHAMTQFTHTFTKFTHYDTFYTHFDTVHTLFTHYHTFHTLWHSSHTVHTLLLQFKLTPLNQVNVGLIQIYLTPEHAHNFDVLKQK